MAENTTYGHHHHHYITTSRKPLPKQVHSRMRHNDSAFNFQYYRFSLRSPNRRLRLLPRLPVPYIFSSIAWFRRQFTHKMSQIRLTFLRFTLWRMLLSSLTRKLLQKGKQKISFHNMVNASTLEEIMLKGNGILGKFKTKCCIIEEAKTTLLNSIPFTDLRWKTNWLNISA